MHFDSTINLGNVITIAALIVSLYGLQNSNNKELQKLHDENIRTLTAIETKLNTIWNWFTTHRLN